MEHTYYRALPAETKRKAVHVWMKKQKRSEDRREKDSQTRKTKHWYDIEKVELMTEKIVSSDAQDASLFKGINYCVKHSSISVTYIYIYSWRLQHNNPINPGCNPGLRC